MPRRKHSAEPRAPTLRQLRRYTPRYALLPPRCTPREMPTVDASRRRPAALRRAMLTPAARR